MHTNENRATSRPPGVAHRHSIADLGLFLPIDHLPPPSIRPTDSERHRPAVNCLGHYWQCVCRQSLVQPTDPADTIIPQGC